MTGFMECRDAFLLVGNHTTLLLRTDSYLYKGFLDIILLNIRTIILCRNNRRLIQKILKIRTGKSCRGLCNLF